jgi:hypothetical protein
MYLFLNAGIPECQTVWFRNKGTQSGTGLLWYRAEIPDAGMLKPAASALMPMPSYVTLYGAVDFLIVPSKGLHGWGGRSRAIKFLYAPVPTPPQYGP